MHTLKAAGAILLLTSLAGSLAGCAKPGSGSSVLPSGGPTMSQIYNGQMSFGAGTDHQLDSARSEVPAASYEVTQTAYKNRPMQSSGFSGVKGYRHVSPQDQQNSGAPKMLPNPSIRVNVSPHFDGNDQDYIPAHTAYVKLYQQAHFALPGEAAK